MTCEVCGARCQGRFCKPCGRDRHREQSLETENTDESQDETDQITYRCTQCGCEYENEGLGQCPDCGGHRARATGGASA